MTIIAAAYDGPNDYAIAADSHSIANAIRIPDRGKVVRAGAVLVGGTGATVESQSGMDYLRGEGLALAQTDLPAALRAMRVHILATTQRVKDCPGLDSHFLAVGPAGIVILGSDGLVTSMPNRWAVGCGEDVGLGAMFCRVGTPAQVVRLAVDAACALREGCFGEAVVLEAVQAAEVAPDSVREPADADAYAYAEGRRAYANGDAFDAWARLSLSDRGARMWQQGWIVASLGGWFTPAHRRD